MKERPILFSGPMVLAILEGRKTQTRRVLSPNPDAWIRGSSGKFGIPMKITNEFPSPNKSIWQEDDGTRYKPIKCKYGTADDRLWVRETWAPADSFANTPDNCAFFYRADNSAHLFSSDNNIPIDTYGVAFDKLRWKPSIHMPRIASRILLEITDIRVERLQDISEEDAKAEGVHFYGWDDTEQNDYKNYLHEDQFDDFGVCSAKESFETLWQSINGPDSWEKNPWVWVIEFEKI